MEKLYFRYGAMNCGKSTHLLQVAHNYEETGLSVLILKPSDDTKGGKNIVSRLGAQREVDYLISKTDSITEIIKNHCGISCILVDEAEFLMPNQVEELYVITKKMDIPVICYGLRCDFQMNGFLGSQRLLLIADDIEEMKTICSCGCGKKATQNMRLENGIPVFVGKKIVIDDENAREKKIEYKPVSGGCYLNIRKKILYKQK